MRSTTLSLSLTALALSLPASADFFLSNSTICMGAFPSPTAGTAPPADLYATQPCGVEGEMHFVKDGVTGYKGLNEEGEEVADCLEDQSLARHCSQWVGAVFFETQYRCVSGSITCT
ncbi:hypothetical protein B0A55_05437 [Friedmanniomyces simplex]|uniref:Cyanovirin-N domain-containing protein n=1 Tax=Friedmanniomyces simplex TaxID=329884 RepID=A0A4U0XGW4_9PEZI|nr:hypothetical protein B0A55_05437 [Friedmanniomyces simplex]